MNPGLPHDRALTLPEYRETLPPVIVFNVFKEAALPIATVDTGLQNIATIKLYYMRSLFLQDNIIVKHQNTYILVL